MTTGTASQLQQIWLDLLSGTITPEQARRILPSIRSSTGQAMNEPSIESFLRTAMEARQQGLASGAAWAQPRTTGPAATTKPTNDPIVTSRDTRLLAKNDAFAAYLRQRGLPAFGGNPAQTWQANQFDPSFSVWQASSILDNKNTPANFADYTAQMNQDPQALDQQAGQLFQQARGGNQMEFQSQLGGDPGNRGVGSDLASLLQSALEGQYATPVARRMARWIPDIATQYQVDTAGKGSALLDYLNQRLGLR